MTSFDSIGQGKIGEDGFASFPITYKAIVYRPFKNEVVDATVSSVTHHGLTAYVGRMQVFISAQVAVVGVLSGGGWGVWALVREM